MEKTNWTVTDPQLFGEWDWEKNIISPEDISYWNKDAKIWWKCQYGHSFKSSMNNRHKSKKCPICSRQEKNEKTWLLGFDRANEYYNNHGDLLVPYDYICEDGYCLGGWITNQRQKYRLKKLSDNQIEKLSSISMAWNKYEFIWHMQYKCLLGYIENGGSLYPFSELPDTNYGHLSTWISTQISAYAKNELDNNKIFLLEKVGICWNQSDTNWEAMYLEAKKYREINGLEHLIIDGEPDNKKLKIWIKHQRAYYKKHNNSNFSEDRIRRLNELGMVWDEYDAYWEEMYNEAQNYYNENKHLNVTSTEGNEKLFTWIRNQRKAYKNKRLQQERISRLENIGMIWSAMDQVLRVSFPEKAIYFYFMQKGIEIEASNRDILGKKELDIYLPSERIAIEYDGLFFHKDRLQGDIEKNELCKEKGIRLIRIREKGLPPIPNNTAETIELNNHSDEELEKVILKLFILINKEPPDICIRRDKSFVAELVSNERSIFEDMYVAATEYYNKYGHLNVPKFYKASNGVDLNAWLNRQRLAYRGKLGTISASNIKRLEAIGMEWNPNEAKWNRCFYLAKEYFMVSKTNKIPRDYTIDGIKLGVWVHTQKKAIKNGSISQERKLMLESIGITS